MIKKKMEERKKEREDILIKYIPENSHKEIIDLLYSHKELRLVITRRRSTKLGDYKKINAYQHKISVNYNLNQYQFLITLLHEIAHFLTYKKYGNRIKPHGMEWKKTFGELLTPFIRPDVFPDELIAPLRTYVQNPKASTASDGDLYLLLSKYDTDKNPDSQYVFELKKGDFFSLENGQEYQLLEKRRTRYKCMRLSNKKIYLIHQNAQVFPQK